MKCYNVNDIRAELTNDLQEADAKLKAWQAVTYPTKKDGQPFAILSKNINGATYRAANAALEATLTNNSARNTYANSLIKDTVNR